jgi:hypothetical protein
MLDARTIQSSAEKGLDEEPGRDVAEIRRAIQVLSEPGDVVELRAFKARTIASGYFDEHEKLVEQAARLDRLGYAVYVTLNSVEPALLARAQNRTRTYPKATTSDRDILHRRWLPLDFDPVRPADVSATDEEKKAALWRAREVRSYLREQGWPHPILGDSGNGYHLLYRVDLSNDRESLELVREVMEALAFRFSDEVLSIDTTTCNAARIWKLYGTTARKGDDTEERPHRVSRLLQIPKEVET